jgi:hypothetical protein
VIKLIHIRTFAALGFAASLLTLGGCDSAEGRIPEIGPVATIAAEGASNPTVALDPRSGRSYIAWVGLEEGVFNVFLASAEEGSSDFGTPVRVNDTPGDAAPHEQAPAQVAVGTEGEVYVLWQNNTEIEGRRFPASDLRFAVSRDGGRTFDRAIFVNDDAGEAPSSHTFHDMVVAPDGSVLVSWIDAREQDRARGHHQHSPSTMGHGEVGPEIRVARSADGGRTFGPSLVVDTNPCPCCRTSMAVDAEGTLFVAWRKVFHGDVRDIVVARAVPGSDRFEAPVRVHDDGWVFPGCPHAGPSIAIDSEGRLHVGWYTGEENRQGLWYSISEDGARSFGTPVPLVTGEFVPASQLSLTAAEQGMWVSWEDRTSESSAVVLGFSRDGQAPGIRAAQRVSGKSPAFAARGNQALLAWLDGESVLARRATLP